MSFIRFHRSRMKCINLQKNFFTDIEKLINNNNNFVLIGDFNSDILGFQVTFLKILLQTDILLVSEYTPHDTNRLRNIK